MSSEVAAVALKAADIIETRGLLKGSFVEPEFYTEGRDDCQVCAMGALLEATAGEPSLRSFLYSKNERAERLYQTTLTWFKSFLFPDGEYTSLATWNDQPERTSEQVVAALRDFAEHFSSE